MYMSIYIRIIYTDIYNIYIYILMMVVHLYGYACDVCGCAFAP